MGSSLGTEAALQYVSGKIMHNRCSYQDLSAAKLGTKFDRNGERTVEGQKIPSSAS